MDAQTQSDGPCTGALRQNIVGIDQQVPLLDGSTRTYVYLDNAASTPPFRSVREQVDHLLTWYSSVHRGTGWKSQVTSRAYDRAHEIVGAFVGADPQRDCVIFGKNTSEATNTLAGVFPWQPGDVVVTTLMEHHSNDLPWRAKAHVEHASILPNGELDIEDLQRRLDRFAGKVRLVAVTGASNVTGFTPPVHAIAEMAHRAGAMILVDCAQLAPHRAIDMGPHGTAGHLDFVCLSGHKLYAPYGGGALVGPRDFFAQNPPDHRGGGTIEVVTRDEVHWAEPPERNEAGSPNVVGAVAMAASIRALTQVGMGAVADHEKELTHDILKKLARIPGIRIYGSCDPERLDDRLGVISFQVEGVPHGKVAAILGFEGGIGVRSGCFCAHPYVLHLLSVGEQEYQVHKARALAHDRSTLPGLVRASFGCYNTFEDVDRLVEMLERVIAGDYRGDYAVDRASGSYFPRGFEPESVGNEFAV